MTKIFLNTLSQFYYERMIASAPSDFSEMVNMGMRLKEGVREGRLFKESVPAGSSKKKEHEFSMVKGYSALSTCCRFYACHECCSKSGSSAPISTISATTIASTTGSKDTI